METIYIKEIKSSDYPYLEDFLYDAIFVPKHEEKPSRLILQDRSLQLYIKDFGQYKDDLGFVAFINEERVGMVWVRKIHDYGYIDDLSPSLSISVKEAFRSKGIGTALIIEIIHALKKRKIPAISLSVSKLNKAYDLYQRLGFKLVRENENDYVMKYKFK